MFPVRFVVATYNIWATVKWPEREPALRAFLQHMQPDILCVQELRPATLQVISEELPDHRHVDDPFPGWQKEGNIFWSTKLFTQVEYGAEDIGMVESARRLFWTRLRVVGSDRTIVVATAHYTWPGHKQEVEQGMNLRVQQARRTVVVLGKLAPAEEPVLFMGDLNESGNAISVLRAGGWRDSFTSRGVNPHATHPAYMEGPFPPQALDWQLCRGPIRPMVSEVVDYYKDNIAPSDHKPLLVTYGLE